VIVRHDIGRLLLFLLYAVAFVQEFARGRNAPLLQCPLDRVSMKRTSKSRHTSQTDHNRFTDHFGSIDIDRPVQNGDEVLQPTVQNKMEADCLGSSGRFLSHESCSDSVWNYKAQGTQSFNLSLPKERSFRFQSSLYFHSTLT
jgi:hypothetical protein